MANCTNATATEVGSEYGMPGWLFAVLLLTVSAFSACIGNLTMKKAQNMEDEKEKHGEESFRIWSIPIKNKWWWLGFFTLAIFPTPLETLAFGAAGASIVFPVGAGLTIVFTQLLAGWFLGEVLTRVDWVATFLIVLGGTLTVVFGTHESPIFTLEQLLGFWAEPTFLWFFLIAWAIALAFSFAWWRFRHAMLRDFAAISIVGISYLAALLTGVQGITLKNASELMKSTLFYGDDPCQDFFAFDQFGAWLFVILVPIVATVQMGMINVGLQNFQATKFVPLYNVLVVTLSSAVGAIYYGEFQAINPVWFPIGMVVLSSGILLLLYKKDPTSEFVAEKVEAEDEEYEKRRTMRKEELAALAPAEKIKARVKSLAKPIRVHVPIAPSEGDTGPEVAPNKVVPSSLL